MTAPRLNDPPPPVPYAGFVTRTLAISVDVFLINISLAMLGIVIGLALSLFGDQLQTDVTTVIAGAAFWVLATVVYFVSFWTLAGETQGMRLMGLRIVSMHGERVGVRQSLRRLVGMVLSALLLMTGFLLILLDDRRQGLHDKIARTFVVYDEEPEEAFVMADDQGPAPVHPPSAAATRPYKQPGLEI